MSGGAGHIILGDDLVGKLIANSGFVAPFRVSQMLDIIKRYHLNENSITRDDQQFLFRCAADVVDNG